MIPDYIVQIVLMLIGAAGVYADNGNLTLWAGLNLIAVAILTK